MPPIRSLRIRIQAALDRSRCDGTQKYIVWFAGRNTGAVVHATSRSGAISRAKTKKVTGYKGAVTVARLCNDREIQLIEKGTWIRTRANGKETGGSYKFRPWLKNNATGDR